MARKTLRFDNSYVFGQTQSLFSVESVTNRTGDVRFRLTFVDEIGKQRSYLFCELLSLFDFIRSNFK